MVDCFCKKVFKKTIFACVTFLNLNNVVVKVQLSAVARGCRQTCTLLLYTVCVGAGLGMKLACKSEYLRPQKQPQNCGYT